MLLPMTENPLKILRLLPLKEVLVLLLLKEVPLLLLLKVELLLLNLLPNPLLKSK
jgi:hypothetical protein